MSDVRIRSRRVQATLLMAVGAFLVWQIITGTFAAYLALEAPERALKLSANEPTALVATADQRLNQAPREAAGTAYRAGPTSIGELKSSLE